MLCWYIIFMSSNVNFFGFPPVDGSFKAIFDSLSKSKSLFSITSESLCGISRLFLKSNTQLRNPSKDLSFKSKYSQTLTILFSPISTSHSFNLSALGCLLALIIFAIIKSLSSFFIGSIFSTSNPILFSLSIIWDSFLENFKNHSDLFRECYYSVCAYFKKCFGGEHPSLRASPR